MLFNAFESSGNVIIGGTVVVTEVTSDMGKLKLI